MYKRRDWLHLHTAEGASDTSDDDSSSEGSLGSGDESSSDAEDSGSEASGGELASKGSHDDDDDDDAPSEDGSASSGDDGVDLNRRLEDLSEDDLEENDWEIAEKQHELEDQLEAWVKAKKEAVVKGRPLKCRLCGGTLILNAKALQQHLGSKKHDKRVDEAEAQGLDAGFDFCFAEDYGQDEDEGETHQERMERITRELDAAKQEQQQQQQQAGKKKKKKKRNQNKAGAGEPGGEQQRVQAPQPSSAKQQQNQTQQAQQQPRNKLKLAAGQGVSGSAEQQPPAVAGSEKRSKEQRKRPGKRQRGELKESGQLPQKMNSQARRQERRKQQLQQKQKQAAAATS